MVGKKITALLPDGRGLPESRGPEAVVPPHAAKIAVSARTALTAIDRITGR